MNPVRALRRVVGAAALLAGAVACGDDTPDIVDPTFTGGELFRSYVALGNSITAGYQSSGINDSTQRESYAYLLARQVYGADLDRRWRYPALAGFGCAPPVNNFQLQTRVGGTAAPQCGLRTQAGVTSVINNVAVPNAYSVDPTSVTTANSNALTTLILGGSSQVTRALQARPTFITAWIGNNDVLAAATSGILVRATTGTGATATVISPGITVDSIFKQSYLRMVDSLAAAPTLRGGALIGVVQVSSAPILFPAAALFNPAFKAGFDQFAGGTVTINANCGTAAAPSASLISFAIAGAMRGLTHPRQIACSPVGTGATAVGNIYVLDAAEQTTLTAAITSFNTFIQQQAAAHDWIYLDPNPLLAQLRATGCVATVPNLASATQTFGPCVSLDGVHPRRPAHVAVANALIGAINTKYGVTIPAVAP